MKFQEGDYITFNKSGRPLGNCRVLLITSYKEDETRVEFGLFGLRCEWCGDEFTLDEREFDFDSPRHLTERELKDYHEGMQT